MTKLSVMYCNLRLYINLTNNWWRKYRFSLHRPAASSRLAQRLEFPVIQL